jgi:hypothetical protein
VSSSRHRNTKAGTRTSPRLCEGEVTAEPAVYKGRSMSLIAIAVLAAHQHRPALGLEGVI